MWCFFFDSSILEQKMNQPLLLHFSFFGNYLNTYIDTSRKDFRKELRFEQFVVDWGIPNDFLHFHISSSAYETAHQFYYFYIFCVFKPFFLGISPIHVNYLFDSLLRTLYPHISSILSFVCANIPTNTFDFVKMVREGICTLRGTIGWTYADKSNRIGHSLVLCC